MNKKTIKDWIQVESRKDLVAIRALTFNKEFAAYIGWAGYGNLGDEAVKDAYKKIFPEYDLKSFGISRPIRAYSKIMHREIPMQFAALGGGTLINQSAIWLQTVQYLREKNVPLFCLGTGVASQAFWDEHPGIHGATSMSLWADLLNEFIFVGVRGPLSQKKLETVGVKSEIVGDSAIALATKTYKKKPFKKIIGINVSYGTDNIMYGDQDLFLKEISQAIEHLLKEDFEVRILPIWKGDADASHDLAERVNNKKCYVVESYESVDSYLAEVNKCSIFVGEKLHSTIFSTMLRIPSLMLEYRPKCLDYMESLGLSQYSIRTDKVNYKLLVRKIHELIEDRHSVTVALDERILHYKNVQIKSAKYIKTRLEAI